jgi:hypothetical protein
VQLVQQGVHDQVGFTSLQRCCQPRTHRRSEISERPEHPGGAEVIAGADKHSRLGGSWDLIADTRLVLPMPASPWSSTIEPVPAAASRAAFTRVASS